MAGSVHTRAGRSAPARVSSLVLVLLLLPLLLLLLTLMQVLEGKIVEGATPPSKIQVKREEIQFSQEDKASPDPATCSPTPAPSSQSLVGKARR